MRKQLKLEVLVIPVVEESVYPILTDVYLAIWTNSSLPEDFNLILTVKYELTHFARRSLM